MAERALVPTPKDYVVLRTAVQAVVLKGRREIDRAWLHTYWETGRLINEHLLQFRERAAYGAKVFDRLSADTGISKRTLQECAQFHRCFPIARTCAQLGWAQCRLLCQVPDPRQREALRLQAIKQDWTVAELQPRVREISAAAEASGSNPASKPATRIDLLTPQRGTPGLHQIVERSDGLAVDLGFKLYWPLTADQSKRFAKGAIVRIGRDDSLRQVSGATKAELFTYAATLRRVVDGDTLVVALEVSPGVWLEQKLRLRGLDSPEMITPEGKVAKRFVEALVAKTTAVIINTTKPDKYDRYLADVFLGVASDLGRGTTGSQQEIFLNNALLENGHAVRKDAWEFGDWEPSLR